MRPSVPTVGGQCPACRMWFLLAAHLEEHREGCIASFRAQAQVKNAEAEERWRERQIETGRLGRDGEWTPNWRPAIQERGDHAEKFERSFEREDGQEVTVEIVVDDWGSAPSGLSGPPEHYDPGSGMEVYVEKAWDTETGEPVTLTDAEREKAEADFCDDPPEADYDDYGD